MSVLSSVTPADKVAVRPESDENRSAAIGALIHDILSYADGGTYGFDAPGRYIVGGFADSVVLKKSATRSEVKATVLRFAAELPIGGTYGIGFWRDEDTGRVWLDSVRTYVDSVSAIVAADENGELAMWDSVTSLAIQITTSRNPLPWYGGTDQ